MSGKVKFSFKRDEHDNLRVDDFDTSDLPLERQTCPACDHPAHDTHCHIKIAPSLEAPANQWIQCTCPGLE